MSFAQLNPKGFALTVFLTFVCHYGEKYYLTHVKHFQASKPQAPVKEINLNE